MSADGTASVIVSATISVTVSVMPMLSVTTAVPSTSSVLGTGAVTGIVTVGTAVSVTPAVVESGRVIARPAVCLDRSVDHARFRVAPVVERLQAEGGLRFKGIRQHDELDILAPTCHSAAATGHIHADFSPLGRTAGHCSASLQ